MRRKRARAAAPLGNAPQEPSGEAPWQQPPPGWFNTILECLMTMPEGDKHVRVASHVCHHWRVAAQEVLLADTAISKPPMEDFRAIGRQHPLPPVKQQKQETVTTQAAVVMEASASTGMEAISKQRFDGPPITFPTAGGALGRGRPGRPGRPAQPPAAAPRPAAGAGYAAAPPEVRRQLQQAVQHFARSLQQQAQQQQAQQQAQQQGQQQQAQQAQQQASAGPGSTVPAAPAAAAGASPSAQQPGEADAPQGSIQSGMAMIGQHHTAAPESESEGGSTRARGPTKRRRLRRGSELSGGRGTSVEQPVRQQAQQAQQAQEAQQAQQAAGGAQRGASGQHAAATAAAAHAGQEAADEAGTSRPSSRRRRRSVSTAGTEEDVRPSKRHEPAEPRRPSRSGLRSSGPASGEGLPDTQRPRSQQAQQAPQQMVQQPAEQAQPVQQAQQAQQQQPASARRRQRPSRASSEQHTAAPAAQARQPERQADEDVQPVPLPAGKRAEPAAASGSCYETAEGGAEVEQRAPAQPEAAEDGEGPCERPEPGEGGLQAAFNVVCRFLRLRE